MLPTVSDESRPLVPMPCVQCGRPPVAGYELPGGQQINLCFRHMQEFEAMKLRQIELYQQLVGMAEDNIADVFGLLRSTRPSRSQGMPPPRVDVHQINIHGDVLGAVNTGTVGCIADGLTVLKSNDAALADALKDLTEAILRSTTLEKDQKHEAMELLREVIEDTAKTAPKYRSRVVMKTIASGLGQVLSHAADLYTLWTAIERHLK